jgi:hypothetical protein
MDAGGSHFQLSQSNHDAHGAVMHLRELDGWVHFCFVHRIWTKLVPPLFDNGNHRCVNDNRITHDDDDDDDGGGSCHHHRDFPNANTNHRFKQLCGRCPPDGLHCGRRGDVVALITTRRNFIIFVVGCEKYNLIFS